MDFTARYGRYALIAGASAGLGAALADGAAVRGLDLVLVARRKGVLEHTAAALHERHGVDVRTVVADLAEPDAVERIADATADIDVGLLVYNAAAEPQGPFLDTPVEDLLANIAVNCTTPTLLVHALGGSMVARGRGGIVLVSSSAALQGIKVFVAYGAAKAYELILGEGLWDELRGHGVDALSYVVGATATPELLSRTPQAASNNPAARQNLPPDTALDHLRTPQQVAATLFEDLAGGPRRYSHAADEARERANAGLTRAEVVTRIGEQTTALWS
jgi:short-subunit dehydrogenase